jgi:hypothetical protein
VKPVPRRLPEPQSGETECQVHRLSVVAQRDRESLSLGRHLFVGELRNARPFGRVLHGDG